MIKWHEVTWYSKLGAVILFVGVVPALSFFIGMQYQAVLSDFPPMTEPSVFPPMTEPLVIRKVEEPRGERGFFEVAKTDTKSFVCMVLLYTESGCTLFARETDETMTDLKIYVDYSSFKERILLSPDTKHLLVIFEDKLQVVDTFNLQQQPVFRAPAGTALGMYTGFPSFIPKARWINNLEIEVSIYPANTFEPYDGTVVASLETKVISII